MLEPTTTDTCGETLDYELRLVHVQLKCPKHASNTSEPYWRKRDVKIRLQRCNEFDKWLNL